MSPSRVRAPGVGASQAVRRRAQARSLAQARHATQKYRGELGVHVEEVDPANRTGLARTRNLALGPSMCMIDRFCRRARCCQGNAQHFRTEGRFMRQGARRHTAASYLRRRRSSKGPYGFARLVNFCPAVSHQLYLTHKLPAVHETRNCGLRAWSLHALLPLRRWRRRNGERVVNPPGARSR